ncbi:MAG: DUF167 domain-containing protein [Candidatus Aenigmarchaeota archaeon]|nr:DUF167 domain-containing protein [Candidatus Aenigmarchaeota archaeon]RLI97538.1 MAG: hypothetical protein DRO96_00530 [Candidatus Aenigmarchaeota archaeon]
MKKTIEVFVKTDQPEFRIEQKEGRTIIFLRAKPENDAANRELVNELRKIYKDVKLLRGFNSKRKTLLIDE